MFTSGGTEAINLALKGVVEMYREKGNHIVTTTIEQRASARRLQAARAAGLSRSPTVPVGRDGLVDVDGGAGAR